MAATVTPPIVVSMKAAPITMMNGMARFTAPSASVPTPLPTNTPSTIVNRKNAHWLSTVGIT